ncbi:hypothetical protein [Streptomyces sp. NPDC058773]|uniref:hypothetical protein n=1 Tax=Streptomyces sp. NPDC058773 TaxID=3346632 RepID=UPI00369231D3
MRDGFTPEIDTCEIADGELDNIAGGNAGAGAEIAGHGAGVSIGHAVEAGGSLAANTPLGQVGGMATVGITSL